MFPSEDPSLYRDLVAAKPPRRRNYLVRHWRGELSLPVSCFVNGVLLAMAASVFFRIFSLAIGENLSPGGALAFTGFGWLLTGALAAWQSVGIWRAAGKHYARTGRTLWAGAARVQAVVGVIFSLSLFALIGWPVLRAQIEIAQGDTAFGTFAVRAIGNGGEIEFSGTIAHGAADALQKALQETPRARVVRFDSPGGRAMEARRMMAMIAAANLDTYVMTKCLSACTIAFLGGKNRYVHADATLGFHAGSIDGIPDAILIEENLKIVDQVARAGVDRAFAAKAYLSPSSSMWYPPVAEMIEARFVTAVSSGQFALTGPDPDRSFFADNLKKNPLYRAIAQYEPAVFARLVDINIDAARAGIPENELIARMRAQTSPLNAKYLPYASTEALVLYMEVTIDEMRLVSATKGAIACHAHVMGTSAEKFDLVPHLGKAELDRYVRLWELVITTGAGKTNKPLPAERIDPLFDRLWRRLTDRYGAEFRPQFAQMQDDNADRRRTCRLMEMFYSEMLKSPPAEAAEMLRSIAARP